MARLKDPDAAKQKAISEMTGLIFKALVAAFIAIYGLPPLLESALGNDTNDALKIALPPLSSLFISLFFMWHSSDSIKNKVGTAIDEAVQQKLEQYRDHQPEVSQILELSRKEYACTIPQKNRNSSSDQAIGRDSSFCRRQAARDVIMQSFNSRLLYAIALKSVKEVTGKRTQQLKQIDKDLYGDIYVYLKGWLMTSIKYSYLMPLDRIEPRYPSHHAYIDAFRLIKDKYIRGSKVSEIIHDSVKANSDDERYYEAITQEAKKLLDEHLQLLIDELGRLHFR